MYCESGEGTPSGRARGSNLVVVGSMGSSHTVGVFMFSFFFPAAALKFVYYVMQYVYIEYNNQTKTSSRARFNFALAA